MPPDELDPQWSPDGRRIVFTSRAKGPGDLYVKDASGHARGRAAARLAGRESTSRTGLATAGTFSTPREPVMQTDGTSSRCRSTATGSRFPLVKTKFNELFATLSPDGKFIAYHSNESGRPEIYVQEFPEARNKWQVSTGGGTQAFWRADGRELFYRTGTADGRAGPDRQLHGGLAAALFETRFAAITVPGPLSSDADGQRFLVLRAGARPGAAGGGLDEFGLLHPSSRHTVTGRCSADPERPVTSSSSAALLALDAEAEGCSTPNLTK